jgi:hypothetical protein
MLGDSQPASLFALTTFESEDGTRFIILPFPLARCDTSGHYAVLPSGVSGSLKPSATCSNARRNVVGNSLPLRSARRRIPAQAFALKKYRRGRSPVSKISESEDATAALWYSGILSVKNPVGEPIPEFRQPSKEGAKIPSFVR